MDPSWEWRETNQNRSRCVQEIRPSASALAFALENRNPSLGLDRDEKDE